MTHEKKTLFPGKIAEQVADRESKRKYLKANAGRFGISSADMAKIDTQVTDATNAYNVASDRDTRTKLDVPNATGLF